MTLDAPLPPSLPAYQAPVPAPQATLPQGMEVKKMPGVMNKMISRALPKRTPKTKGVRMGHSIKSKGIRIVSSVKIKSRGQKKNKMGIE